MEFNNIENNSNYISRLTLMHNKNYYIDNLYLISLRMIKDIYKGEVSSIMFCDINGLKLVNDSSGHLEGDKIIRRIANIIRNCVKKGNNLSDNITNPTSQESDKRKNEVIHLGGDEFLVVLPKCNKEKARAIKENIYNIIDEKIEFFDGASLSIGIADTTDIELPKNIDISNIEEVVEYAHAIIKLADKNMYKEKNDLTRLSPDELTKFRLKSINRLGEQIGLKFTQEELELILNLIEDIERKRNRIR